jgi:3'(2'), 5'-bisphosphate nucleotidase
MSDLNHLLWLTAKASIKAGEEILSVYNTNIEVEFKDDKSPLTEADKKSHIAIMEALEETKIPVLSEEGKQLTYKDREDWDELWVVDPLDGTKEFIKRNGEFTVNIALVKNQIPILGVIYVPVEETLYFGAEGIGAFKFNGDLSKLSDTESLISASVKLPVDRERNFTVVGSRSHMSEETQAYFNQVKEQHPDAEVVSRGSSLKICMVAEGSADVYPRFAPTMEWDTAAGHAIVRQAGFEIFHTDVDTPLKYNKPDLLNPWFIVKENIN